MTVLPVPPVINPFRVNYRPPHRYLDTVEVAGSSPVVPTISFNRYGSPKRVWVLIWVQLSVQLQIASGNARPPATLLIPSITGRCVLFVSFVVRYRSIPPTFPTLSETVHAGLLIVKLL